MHIQAAPGGRRISSWIAAPWRLLPLLMTAALLSGVINGIIAGAMTTEHRQCRT